MLSSLYLVGSAIVWAYLLEVSISNFFKITTIKSLELEHSDSVINQPLHAFKYLVWFAVFVYLAGVFIKFWKEKDKYTSKIEDLFYKTNINRN